MLLRLLARARAPVELAEAEVAVGDEGRIPSSSASASAVTVVALSVLRGIAAGGDLAEEAEGPRFVGALTALAGKGQGSPGEFESVLEPVGEDVRFAQIRQEERLDKLRIPWSRWRSARAPATGCPQQSAPRARRRSPESPCAATEK